MTGSKLSMKPALTRKQLAQCRQQAATLFEQGLSNAEVGRRIGISRQTVSGWRQRFQVQGEAGLQLHPPGPDPRLSQQQQEQLVASLLQGPLAFGYDTQLWTLERIADLIAKQTGITYHPGHVWRLMRQWHWTCQKPEGVAKERNEAAIDHWLEVEWPRIKKGPSSEGPL